MRKNWRSKIDKETSVKYMIDYSESATLSPWQYFGLGILYAIPVVGTVFLILACMDNRNKNVRNFARAFVLFLALALVCAIVFLILVRFDVITMDTFRTIKNWLIK